MSSVLERVPVDRIRSEAQEIRFARTVAVIFSAIFFAIGWVLGMAWNVVAWGIAAAKVGWQDARARNPRAGPPGGD